MRFENPRPTIDRLSEAARKSVKVHHMACLQQRAVSERYTFFALTDLQNPPPLSSRPHPRDWQNFLRLSFDDRRPPFSSAFSRVSSCASCTAPTDSSVSLPPP